MLENNKVIMLQNKKKLFIMLQKIVLYIKSVVQRISAAKNQFKRFDSKQQTEDEIHNLIEIL